MIHEWTHAPCTLYAEYEHTSSGRQLAPTLDDTIYKLEKAGWEIVSVFPSPYEITLGIDVPDAQLLRGDPGTRPSLIVLAKRTPSPEEGD